VTSTLWNGLPAFSLNTTATADYTAVIADSYQVLQQMNKATAIAFKIPTNAAAAIPVGSVITVLNIGVGTCTISAVTPGTTTVLAQEQLQHLLPLLNTNRRPVLKLALIPGMS
jgi:hypothetical protein